MDDKKGEIREKLEDKKETKLRKREELEDKKKTKIVKIRDENLVKVQEKRKVQACLKVLREVKYLKKWKLRPMELRKKERK